LEAAFVYSELWEKLMLKLIQASTFILLLFISAAHAQREAAGPASIQDDSGISPWPWLILAVVIVAALIWNFRRRRNRSL
jgi:hypothetical protein